MSDPLAALTDLESAWLVGGAVRDELLGRPVTDFDVALGGDVKAAARALAAATGGSPFALSHAFGAWRVAGPAREWQGDFMPLQGATLEQDLGARDFTINAMARELGGGEVIDPHGGRADLQARRLRMVSAGALADDPLRCLRAARHATELGLTLDPATAQAARANAPQLSGVAGERIFAELKRILLATRPSTGLLAMDELGVTGAMLPELLALRGVEQNVFHHLDVYAHTLAVLDATAALWEDPSPLGAQAGAVLALLDQPLADELSRGGGLRLAALLHDIAKPATRGEGPGGRVTFIGHDSVGADVAAGILRRLRASEKLVAYVAALTREHLRLGFLVHERPLSRRAVWRYLKATEPWSVDVTVLTIADRLATRGRNAEPAIAAHLEVAQDLLGHALADTDRAPLIRGDELARELGIRPGPRLGELLAVIEEDRYAGELATREQALARARDLL